MNPFAPANLSPLVKPPRACALPYDLTWDDLATILPDYDVQLSTTAQAFVQHEKQGLNGGDNSCILTLLYPTLDHQRRSETIFIKRTTNTKQAEAQRYQFLASQGVPTPRVLAVIQREDAEIIFLEFLPTIGIDFRDADEVNSLLHLAARLNAIRNEPTLFKRPFRESGSASEVAFDSQVLAALAELSHDPALQAPINVSRWFDAYQFACEAAASMPPAVVHSEFYFQQVGWAQRAAGRELVVFDLETMIFGPRFTDIASFLYPLASYAARDQVELLGMYLDHLHERSEFDIGLDAALHEVRLLRISYSCQGLPWLVSAARQSEDASLRGTLSLLVECLRSDLIALELA